MLTSFAESPAVENGIRTGRNLASCAAMFSVGAGCDEQLGGGLLTAVKGEERCSDVAAIDATAPEARKT
jgi:hypothetical protein